MDGKQAIERGGDRKVGRLLELPVGEEPDVPIAVR
jgi:hypothetical protein